MRRAWSTLVLLVVALALGAYIYFVESKRKPASERAEEKGKVFAELDSTTVEELEVKSATGELTKLKKENDRWKVVAPVTAEADESEVSSITSNLGTLEIQRVVDEKGADLTQFGLAPAKTAVSFRISGDPASRQLLFGDKTATGGDLYAKVASDPRVFLVSAFVESTFNRSTFDLRDKSVLKFERDKITSVEIVAPDRTIAFAKDGETWKMTAPKTVRADVGTVDGLIGRISTGQMKALVAEAPDDLAKYGLDKPVHTVTFVAGSARSSLLFGSKTPEGQFYARDASRPLVFTVESFLSDDLDKAPDDFRPKDLYEFRTFTGTRFEVTRDGTTTVFEKRKGQDASAPETWAQVQPEKTVDATKIEDFLSKMSNLRAQAFVDAVPQGATELMRTLARWSEGKRDETVTFHKAGEDIFAVRGAEAGAARLTASDYDDATKALEALK